MLFVWRKFIIFIIVVILIFKLMLISLSEFFWNVISLYFFFKIINSKGILGKIVKRR